MWSWIVDVCVCRWRQEVWVECSRHQQHVLRVALTAVGGSEWPGPPKCSAHLSHQRGDRGGKCCGQASGHSCKPCRHREHPQDRQGGEEVFYTGVTHSAVVNTLVVCQGASSITKGIPVLHKDICHYCDTETNIQGIFANVYKNIFRSCLSVLYISTIITATIFFSMLLPALHLEMSSFFSSSL